MNKAIEVANTLHSSYKANDLGWLFFNLVKVWKPAVAVEIGTLFGYSAIFIGAAMQSNGQGRLTCYDLFDQYPYKHSPIAATERNIAEAGLDHIVDIQALDMYEVPAKITTPVDFIHVDVSNDGDTYRWAMDAFKDKLNLSGLLVLEGGCAERDQVDWMKRYKKTPITNALEDIPLEYLLLGVAEAFPGVTVLMKT